ncbi:hypothetical protein [Patulibacter sp. SYSU D01012]|uniref:hypothetical protein n=1 Tax=Patulibacter sp. SYSU D01012 TaxID=2817381 RepID=UPI001B3045AC|nr:hypothetical protein [Patulibacter sp. SYSU D01012]
MTTTTATPTLDATVEPEEHPEVPTPDENRPEVMPNRPSGPGEHPGPDPDDPDRGPATTPDPDGPHPDPDPDPTTPPDPVPDPDPEDPSVSR